MFSPRPEPEQSSAGCCCVRRHHRVSPLVGSYPGYDMVETSPGRVIRVIRRNPARRSPALEERMQRFIATEYGTRHHSNKVGVIQSPRRPGSSKAQRTKSAGPLRRSLKEPKSAASRSGFTSPMATPVHDPVKTNSTDRRNGVRTATSVQVNMRNNIAVDSDDEIEEISQVVQEEHETRVAHATPVFLIHGVGGSADVWTSQLEYFESQGYEVLVPELLGHGFSGAPRESSDYLFKNLARDMVYIFDRYCKETNIVIGHSYGASFASYIARERPDWVSHLILISGGSPTPLEPQPGVFTLPVSCLQCCQPLLKGTFKRSAFHSLRQPGVPRDVAFDVPTYVLKYTMMGQDWPDGTSDYHAGITATTLLLHGHSDQLISEWEENEMRSAIPDCDLVILDNTSHMLMMEAPQKVNKLIHDFITRDPGERCSEDRRVSLVEAGPL